MIATARPTVRRAFRASPPATIVRQELSADRAIRGQDLRDHNGPGKRPLNGRKRAAELRNRSIEFIPNDRFAGMEAAALSPALENLLASDASSSERTKRPPKELGMPLARACELPLLTAAEERELFEHMNWLKYRAAQLREWLEDQPTEATLSEIEGSLRQAEQIRNRIVGANVRLVISIAKTFADAKNPFDELVSEGILSMMHAVEKFDFDRGFRFSTYATRAIRRNLYRLLVQRQKERSRYASAANDVTLEIADERNHSAITEQRWNELQRQMKRLLHQLDARERFILRARFGMNKTGQVQTLQALAKSLGVCKERVRQLEKRAIEKLQRLVDEVRIEEPAA